VVWLRARLLLGQDVAGDLLALGLSHICESVAHMRRPPGVSLAVTHVAEDARRVSGSGPP
jgi:hypothetical protein